MPRHTVTGRWKLGLALAALTAFQFGAIPIALKLLLKKIDPFTLSWYRFIIAALFMGVATHRSHGLFAPLRLRGKRLLLMVIAILGLSTNLVVYTVGLDYSSPNTAQVMIQLAPVLLGLGGLIIFRESFSLRQTFGLLILIVGLVLFFDGKYDEILSGTGTLWLGIVLITFSAAMWASYGLAQKQLLTVLPAGSILFSIYTCGSLPFLLVAQPSDAMTLTIVEWLLMVLSAVATAVSYFCLGAAMNHLEASRVSVVLATPPLFTVGMVALLAPIFPAYVEAEPISWVTVLGIFLVVCGSILASLKREESNTVEP